MAAPPKRARFADASTDALDLADSDVSEADVVALTEALAANASLSALDMARCGIGPEAGRALAAALRCSSLRVLNLERNGLGVSGGRALGEALSSNATLASLDASLNDIGPEGGRAFGVALSSNASLTALSMWRSGLGPEGGKAFAKALEANSTLTSLDLMGNDFGLQGGVAFGAALAVNRSLTDLNMRWNRIGFGAAGAVAFAAGLARNSSLVRLNLNQNELGAAGAAAVAEALAVNRALTSLSLDRNELGPEGARAVADAVRVGSLRRLSIAHNELLPAGGRALGDALSANRSLESLDVSQNGIGAEGGAALAEGASAHPALRELELGSNGIGDRGASPIAAALGSQTVLARLGIGKNGIGAEGAAALAASLSANVALRSLDLGSNEIGADDGRALVAAVAAHPALTWVDLSRNSVGEVALETQLRLARNTKLRLDLSGNPLSSPPLGWRAGADELRLFLGLLEAESSAVTRLRLMVLGFGGVGKSTFCAAATCAPAELPRFHGSLTPLLEWDDAAIGEWARGLGTSWSEAAAAALQAGGVRGSHLSGLVESSDAGGHVPSAALAALVGSALDASALARLARAIGSLLRKGYFSTVGAINVDGLVPLEGEAGTPQRHCSLVDFAGQMEYLVTHQLLLSSMHTLCLVLQPAASFSQPQHRHHGSWAYWVRFLRALGDRRTGSLLLGVSQLDRAEAAASAAAAAEFARLSAELGGIGDAPLQLDYRAHVAEPSMREVRRRLGEAAEAVARDWWVPASYEKLAGLVRRLGLERSTARQLPILSRAQLQAEVQASDDDGLRRMGGDPQLLGRGVEYLEAVGDVMSDARLDCLLLDPVGWFASFLAHFIRDDGNPPAEVQRGVVSRSDIVSALRHEYRRPEEQVPAVMSLVCTLELCVPVQTPVRGLSGGARAEATSYLFPCLLPACASTDELRGHWPVPAPAGSPAAADPLTLVYRGHRFRASAGFLPPGLFPGLLARLRHLPEGCTHATGLWKDGAVLRFGRARVLLRLDPSAATLDVLAAGPTAEDLFVGAAKGQASVVVWLAHLIRRFVRTYRQLLFEEAWLCPTAECHGVGAGEAAAEGGRPPLGAYSGTEFAVEPGKRPGEHTCEAEGCWHQLGTGHKLEAMRLRDGAAGCELCCERCRRAPCFSLRGAV